MRKHLHTQIVWNIFSSMKHLISDMGERALSNKWQKLLWVSMFPITWCFHMHIMLVVSYAYNVTCLASGPTSSCLHAMLQSPRVSSSHVYDTGSLRSRSPLQFWPDSVACAGLFLSTWRQPALRPGTKQSVTSKCRFWKQCIKAAEYPPSSNLKIMSFLLKEMSFNDTTTWLMRTRLRVIHNRGDSYLACSRASRTVDGAMARLNLHFLLKSTFTHLTSVFLVYYADASSNHVNLCKCVMDTLEENHHRNIGRKSW